MFKRMGQIMQRNSAKIQQRPLIFMMNRGSALGRGSYFLRKLWSISELTTTAWACHFRPTKK